MLDSVREAKHHILNQTSPFDYLPIQGLDSFSSSIAALLFSPLFLRDHADRVSMAQAIGGTGALRIGADLFLRTIGKKAVIAKPTWPNHRAIFEASRFEVSEYEYYNSNTHRFDFEAMCRSLDQLPPKTMVLLQAVCHNPTGFDPSLEEWKFLSRFMLERQLFPFFDCAYQGFGSDLIADSASIRIFAEDGHELLIAYSCSKNFGLYGERVGAFFALTSTKKAKDAIDSQIKRVIRTNYSNPPGFGAKVVEYILNTPSLRQKWETELSQMRERIVQMRQQFVRKLSEPFKSSAFDFLKHHQGMFSFLDLESSQVDRLKKEFGIHMMGTGRINVAGLNENNIDYVVKSILQVTTVL